MPTKGKFSDESNEEMGWCSSSTSSEERPLPVTPSLYERWRGAVPYRRLPLRRLNDPDHTKRTRRWKWCKYLLIVVGVLIVFGIIAGLVYISLVTALINELAPPPNYSGLQRIVENWTEPDNNGAHEVAWQDDFSRDIVPKKCHSHNDYWRSVPLYSALAAGCTSVEADVWLAEDGELLVSHSWKTTTRQRTLRNLYLDPLAWIFTKRNISQASVDKREVGVFDADADASVVLLIDFKNDGYAIWPALLSQLQPLRDRNWLTYYDGKEMYRGPLTIVGTGNTPLELVQSNMTNRFVFFDAPLLSVSAGNTTFNSTNSYYASASFKDAIGKMWFNRLSAEQERTLKSQIEMVQETGLQSRYWDTPAWPISLRDRLWFKLTELGVGVLNVDDLVSATKWNWHRCIVAGLTLC
ncbi:Altered inheritance of mitochondria 6 [Pyrenophora seminiperda CCB06]|uniref:Altered inheritance of mitochondria protein 6 n=1 Tax=Pyrenophora seminiperda CCB06 TaxID=1302712 RepID=A0A3M7MJX6_9PLEO|nr:Altered inheritance of mitochondria 6 [Pyrenophora seminiperda CCB06]